MRKCLQMTQDGKQWRKLVTDRYRISPFPTKAFCRPLHTFSEWFLTTNLESAVQQCPGTTFWLLPSYTWNTGTCRTAPSTDRLGSWLLWLPPQLLSLSPLSLFSAWRAKVTNTSVSTQRLFHLNTGLMIDVNYRGSSKNPGGINGNVDGRPSGVGNGLLQIERGEWHHYCNGNFEQTGRTEEAAPQSTSSNIRCVIHFEIVKINIEWWHDLFQENRHPDHLQLQCPTTRMRRVWRVTTRIQTIVA